MDREPLLSWSRSVYTWQKDAFHNLCVCVSFFRRELLNTNLNLGYTVVTIPVLLVRKRFNVETALLLTGPGSCSDA